MPGKKSISKKNPKTPVQLKVLMPKQWSNTAAQPSVAPLICSGLIPDGGKFLPSLPPSLLGNGEWVLCPTSLQPPFPRKQPGTRIQLAPLFIPSRTKVDRWQYRCGLTFPSLHHRPVTVTTEHKGTLKAILSRLPKQLLNPTPSC